MSKHHRNYCIHCCTTFHATDPNVRECKSCQGEEIDPAVKLRITRKAKCGHISANYFHCSSCLNKLGDHDRDLQGIAAMVRRFDMRRIDPTYDPREEQLKAHERLSVPNSWLEDSSMYKQRVIDTEEDA